MYLSINCQEAGFQQTLNLEAVERKTGIRIVTFADLLRYLKSSSWLKEFDHADELVFHFRTHDNNFIPVGSQESVRDFEERYYTATFLLKTVTPQPIVLQANSTPIQSVSTADITRPDITIGTANSQEIKLAEKDRSLGVVLLGQTGFGKTSLMEHLIAQDMNSLKIFHNTTAIVFDPHGELSERILRIGAAKFPSKILFCEIGNNLSYGFNPLEVKTPGDPLEESQTIDSLMQVFRKHWSDNPAYSFGSRVEWVLSNTARTILANPGYTLAEIPLLLHDRAFRDKLVRNVTNPQVQFFWGEYRQLEATRRPLDTWQMVESTVTRLTQFLANEWLYRVLYQAKGTIKFHELIESGKTIIFSLPIGKLGEEPAALLGSMLLGKLVTTIYGRNEYGRHSPRLHVYIDEYSRFATPITANLLT